ncbi:MAG TPA: histidine kinase, partial [Rhodothermales bacterium]|nr:histidine kinase [Rhodothermales bacterium]
AGTLEAQLAQAALASLRAQLQPHFLFNTLNAISTLLGERPVEARRALAELAELLRETLTRGETVETTLEEELDWIERYLELQSLRYGDRLRVEIEVTPGVLAALVPTMLLQPLVENALQHGITARRGTGRLRIAADRSGQALRLVVEDDGPGPVLEEERREGVGLSNTRRRLHVLYGEAGRLELCPAEGGGTASVVELPFHTGPPRPASVPTWAETSAAA